MTEFSCGLSTIHVPKDEQRQLSPGSFMTLKISRKQLQRRVECSAHDLQRVGAVDIILAAVEWEHSSPVDLLFALRANRLRRLPRHTVPEVCDDCESGPADVINVIASIGWAPSASICVGFFQFCNSAVPMWRRCSETFPGARLISIVSPGHDIPWHAADTPKLCSSPLRLLLVKPTN